MDKRKQQNMKGTLSREEIENLLRFQEKNFSELDQAAKDDNLIFF